VCIVLQALPNSQATSQTPNFVLPQLDEHETDWQKPFSYAASGLFAHSPFRVTYSDEFRKYYCTKTQTTFKWFLSVNPHETMHNKKVAKNTLYKK